MGNQKVTTTSSATIGVPAGLVYLTQHAFLPPAVGPTHIEMCTPAYYPPGIGAHKFTGTVFHQGKPIAKDGHDHGPNILHWNVPPWPPNPLLILHIPFSSRKIMFGASRVKMNGGSTGCNNPWIPTPMMACSSPCGFPIGYPVNHGGHTCLVGMTLGDFLAGAFAIAASMVVDILLAGKGRTSWLDQLLGKLGLKYDKDYFIKVGVGVGVGLVKILLTGEGSFDIPFGGDKAGGKFTVKKKRKPGTDGDIFDLDEWEVDYGVQAGSTKKSGKAGDNTETTITTSDWDWDGSGSTEETKVNKHPDGSRTETITETYYDRYGGQEGRSVTENKYDPQGRLIESKSPLGEVRGKGNPTSDAMNPKGDEPL